MKHPTTKRDALEAVLLGLILAAVLAIFLTSYYAAAVLDAKDVGLLGALSAVAVLGLTIEAGRAR